MQISVLSPLGCILPIAVTGSSSAATVFSSLFGCNLNPHEFSVTLNEKILSPYTPLSTQGVTNDSFIKFMPTSQYSLELFRNSFSNFHNILQDDKKFCGFHSIDQDKSSHNEKAEKETFLSSPSSSDYLAEEDKFDEKIVADIDIKEQNCIRGIVKEAERLKELKLSKLELMKRGGIIIKELASIVSKSDEYNLIDDFDFPEEKCDHPPKRLSKDPLPCFWIHNPDDDIYQEYLDSLSDVKYNSIEEACGEIRKEEKNSKWQW